MGRDIYEFSQADRPFLESNFKWTSVASFKYQVAFYETRAPNKLRILSIPTCFINTGAQFGAMCSTSSCYGSCWLQH